MNVRFMSFDCIMSEDLRSNCRHLFVNECGLEQMEGGVKAITLLAEI